jgi:hypothetical protein
MKASRSVSVMALPGWRHREGSAIRTAAYSRGVLLVSALLLIAARQPPAPSGELVLDAANPVIEAEIQGVPLRLRVDLDQQDSIELNPAAAARLPVTWEDGFAMDVGRVRLESRIAAAQLQIADRTVLSRVSEHGRDCCAGLDGAIGPDLLPYASVHWRRTDAPAPIATLALPLEASPTTGLSAASDADGVRLRFAFAQPETIGTAAAGAILARLWGGHWSGSAGHVTLAFGISRPARTIAFARPAVLAGFRFDQLRVRISDFAGDEKLPSDPSRAEDVVVSHRLRRQQAWPAVTIGADRLSRCADLVYYAVPRSLTLHCAFDQR